MLRQAGGRIGVVITLTSVLFALVQIGSGRGQEAPLRPVDGFTGGAGHSQQQGKIRYVASDGDDNSDCSTVASPCRTVQYAVDQAQTDDTIHVAEGIYTEPEIAKTGYVVVLQETVSLMGGFPSAFDGPPDPVQRRTVLDAQGEGRVVHITGGAPLIEGFVITGGFSTSSGAGVHVESAEATLFNNRIVANHTERGGGGIFANRSNIRIINNIVLSNTATWSGGMRIINDSAATVIGNRIEENEAQIAGGGIDIGCCGKGFAVVERNTVLNNKGGLRGGGLNVSDTGLFLANNVFAGNSAARGSALHADGQSGYPAELDIIHNTLAGPKAGGDAFWGEGYVTATLANNILTGFTTAITISAPLSATVVADHNLFHDNNTDTGPGVTNVGAIHGNPMFVAPTLFDYHLQSGSPAINKGLGGLTNVDIDEQMRDALPDLGADESNSPSNIRRTHLPMIRKL